MSIFQDVMSADYAVIAREFQVNPEHCENPEHYQNFIKQDSFTDHKQGMGVTHVFVDQTDDSKKKLIAGYITLRSSSLIMESGEKYKLGYPALEIAELAAVGFYSNKVLKFQPIRQMQAIPREHRNSNCEPMMLKIIENN